MCLNLLFKISLHFKFSEFTFKFLFLPFLLWDPTKSCPKRAELYRFIMSALFVLGHRTLRDSNHDIASPWLFATSSVLRREGHTKSWWTIHPLQLKKWKQCFHWDNFYIRSTSTKFLPSAVSPIFGTLSVFNFSMYTALTNLSQGILRHSHFIDLNQLHLYGGFYLSLLWETCHMSQNKMSIPSQYTGWLRGVPIMGQQPRIYHGYCFRTCW